MATIHSFSLYYQLMNSCLRKLYCERICLPDSPQLVNRELHQTFYVDGNHSSIKMQALLDLRSIQMYTNLYDSWQHVDGTYQQAKPLHLGLFFDRFTVREDMSFLHPLFQPLCSCELFVRNDRFLFVQNDNTILYLQDARQIVCSHDPLSQENNVCDILDTIICNTVVETCFGYKQYFNYNEKPKSNGMLEKWKKIIHGIGYNNGKQKSNARASGSKQRCAKDPKSVKSCVKGSGSNTSVGRNGTKIKTDVLSTKIQHIETLKTNTFADKQLIVPDANAATCNFSSPTTASGSPLSRNFGPIHKNSSPASINLGMQFPTLSTCIASNQQDPILQTTAYHQQFAPHAALQNAQLTQNALSQQYAMHHNASFFREDSQRQALLRSSPISLTTHSGNNETNAIVSENKIVDTFQQLHKQQEHFIQAQFQYGHQQQYQFQQHAQGQVVALPISLSSSKKFADRISLQQKPSPEHREQQAQMRFIFQHQQQQQQQHNQQHQQQHVLSHQQQHQPAQFTQQQSSFPTVPQQSISPKCEAKSQESENRVNTNHISIRATKKSSIASTVTVTQNTVSKLRDSEKHELDYKDSICSNILGSPASVVSLAQTVTPQTPSTAPIAASTRSATPKEVFERLCDDESGKSVVGFWNAYFDGPLSSVAIANPTHDKTKRLRSLLTNGDTHDAAKPQNDTNDSVRRSTIATDVTLQFEELFNESENEFLKKANNSSNNGDEIESSTQPARPIPVSSSIASGILPSNESSSSSINETPDCNRKIDRSTTDPFINVRETESTCPSPAARDSTTTINSVHNRRTRKRKRSDSMDISVFDFVDDENETTGALRIKTTEHTSVIVGKKESNEVVSAI